MFTVEELNLILKHLGTGQFNEVAPLINKIMAIGNQMVAEQQNQPPPEQDLNAGRWLPPPPPPAPSSNA